MANRARQVAENVAGNFFVDDSCIDCDQCREIAPATFGDGDGHARVWRQPDSAETRRRATMALVTCPVGAIGAEDRKGLAETLPQAFASLPERIEDNVYFCGYASSSSFGASSYLIARPEGNILVDCPRFASQLTAQLDRMGGVASMFLSHQDDIADHEQFHRRFHTERIFHRAENHPAAGAMERLIDGNAPQSLGPDLVALPTPGHTRGHMER
jgi:ferredoxin